MKSLYKASTAAFLLSVITILIAGLPASAQTYTLSTLATFNGSNGGLSAGSLILSSGILYGTTAYDGADGDGTVFSVPAGGGAVTTLATFNGSNGERPFAGLILSGGTLYGTTEFGGDLSLNGGLGYGTVFSVPVGGGAVTTLATFNSTNGAFPNCSLILSGSSLYGTTVNGGALGNGTVFSVPVGGGAVTTLASFNLKDGMEPYAGLILSGSTLYGTTYYGGDTSLNSGLGGGTVFSIPVGGGAVTTLATFNGNNGEYPRCSLLLNGGTLYGTTQYGGNTSLNKGAGYGSVFSVPVGGGAVTTLATFNGANGWAPNGGLVLNGGTLNGTTYYGGDLSVNSGQGYGTVFAVPVGGGAVTTLATFNDSNGWAPHAGLILSGGTLYGTTFYGGAHGAGTVFALAPICSTYALWNNASQASLWNIPAAGSPTTASFGPLAGWTPAALASDTSGNAYILWTTTAGGASVWKVSSSLKMTTAQSFGPYTGWAAKTLAVGPDGTVHLLWNHTADNEASIFNITLGSSFASKAYGPFNGWQATQIAVDSNNNTKLLWNNTSLYEASLWNITSSGTQTSQTFGPYSGWQAQILAVGSDNLARMLWENTTTKQASVFTISSSGSIASQALGPYSGWTPTGLAVNNDGDSDLMWNSTSNQLSIFDIGSTGSFTSSAYGPISGWKAIGIAPGP